MKNAQRQDACSTSQPPRTGPMAAVIAVKPDHVPMACPRLFSSNDVPMIARLPGREAQLPRLVHSSRLSIDECLKQLRNQ